MGQARRDAARHPSLADGFERQTRGVDGHSEAFGDRDAVEEGAVRFAPAHLDRAGADGDDPEGDDDIGVVPADGGDALGLGPDRGLAEGVLDGRGERVLVDGGGGRGLGVGVGLAGRAGGAALR